MDCRCNRSPHAEEARRAVSKHETHECHLSSLETRAIARPSGGARWSDIKDLSGEKLNATYVKLLDKLSKQGGIIGARPQVSLKELAKANGLPV